MALDLVALYARAWVEMIREMVDCWVPTCRPLREGVGRNCLSRLIPAITPSVALYARAWVEIIGQRNPM